MTDEPDADGEEQSDTATVKERKFNGTATLRVTASSPRKAEAAANQYFRDKHGERPTNTVVKKRDHQYPTDDGKRYTVIVTDHSSGSHADSETYDFDQ